MDSHFWEVAEWFVGTKWNNCYDRKLKRAENSPFGWNWAAFFLGEIWVAYRKIPCVFGGMILYYLICISIALFVAPKYFLTIIIVMLIAGRIACSLMGDRWYYGSIKLKYRFFILGDFSSGESLSDDEFVKQGGTAEKVSAAYVVTLIVLAIVITTL